MSWVSPDGNITKTTLKPGNFGRKPSENSVCKIVLTQCPKELETYNTKLVTIGDNDTEFGRCLDICLMTMLARETSNFTVSSEPRISFKLELVEFKPEDLIYKWSAEKKVDIATHQKEKGVELFKTNQTREAACRFNKALKILHSIPIDVEKKPEKIDAISVSDINYLKGNLYNNLSSCYLRNESWLVVIDMCKKVLEIDSNNIKALFKMGVAYKHDRDYENAHKALMRVKELEPHNKACEKHLKFITENLNAAQNKVDIIVKNMFKNI